MRKRKKQLSGRSTPGPNECLIRTEGIEYCLNWAEFPVFGFVFIRCVGTDEVCKTIRGSALKHGIGIAIRVGIRNGYWGVGVWRTK